MPVESAADRASFTNAAEFGVTAQYTVAGGSPVAVSGIFDDAYQLLGGFDVGQEGSGPVFEMRDTDLPGGAAQGDAISISGSNYSIVEFMPDGTGMVILRLHVT